MAFFNDVVSWTYVTFLGKVYNRRDESKNGNEQKWTEQKSKGKEVYPACLPAMCFEKERVTQRKQNGGRRYGTEQLYFFVQLISLAVFPKYNVKQLLCETFMLQVSRYVACASSISRKNLQLSGYIEVFGQQSCNSATSLFVVRFERSISSSLCERDLRNKFESTKERNNIDQIAINNNLKSNAVSLSLSAQCTCT